MTHVAASLKERNSLDILEIIHGVIHLAYRLFYTEFCPLSP